MPTYEYECEGCGHRFEQWQSITADALTQCPDCGGPLRRLVSGGAGFIMKGATSRFSPERGGCSLEREGRTCCGRAERCDAPRCEE